MAIEYSLSKVLERKVVSAYVYNSVCCFLKVVV